LIIADPSKAISQKSEVTGVQDANTRGGNRYERRIDC